MKICNVCGRAYADEVQRCPVDKGTLRTVHDPLLGRTVAGRYRLISRLGTGGMSSVYLARHVLLDRLVAVKTLRRDLARDPVHRDRFLREARAANRINHPNIVEISDFGETDDGLFYLLLEYVPGVSLLEALQDSPFSTLRALAIAEQLGSALGRAHEMGVIHRDLKPENILLVHRDDQEFVKVLDFGVAKILDAPSLTGSQQIFGTPGYIAPEYIRSSDIDGRADLYSLGVILYEMATGALPFDYEFPGDLLVKHVTEPPIPPHQRFPGIDAALEGLILRCLLKDPAERHRDAFHFLEDLQRTRERVGGGDSWGGMQSEPPARPRSEAPSAERPSTLPSGTPEPAPAPERPAPERPAPAAHDPNTTLPAGTPDRVESPAPRRNSVVTLSPIIVRDSRHSRPEGKTSSAETSSAEIEAPADPRPLDSGESARLEEIGAAYDADIPPALAHLAHLANHPVDVTIMDALSATIQEVVREPAHEPAPPPGVTLLGPEERPQARAPVRRSVRHTVRHTMRGRRDELLVESSNFSPRAVPTTVDERIRRDLAALPVDERLDAAVASARGRFDAYRAAIASARRRIAPEMERAHLEAETTMAALESLVDEVQDHEDELEDLHNAARDLRGTLGHAIDELAMQLSRDRGALEKTVKRRDRLRGRRELMRQQLQDGEISEGAVDAVLWELGALEQRARLELARCDEQSGRLGALREQLEERNAGYETEIGERRSAMAKAVGAADRLRAEVEAHLETMRAYLVGEGLLA